MIGIVVVSHSRRLAEAALELALEMVPPEARPRVVVAAGLDETTFGTDATAVAAAFTEVDSPDGVLALMDLGSSLLSAEMALEFVDPGLAARVRLSPAPLVEGLVAALVTASTGAPLLEVAGEAERACLPKRQQVPPVDPTPGTAPAPGRPATPGSGVVRRWRHTVTTRHGLHTRPAAALVARLRDLDATVLLRNATTGAGPADARSLGRVASLGLVCGHELEAEVSGPDAVTALERLRDLAATVLGEDPPAAVDASPVQPLGTGRQVVVGPARVVAPDVDTTAYEAGDPAAEQTRLDAAVATVGARLDRLAATHGDAVGAQAAMLGDPDLAEGFAAEVAAGASALDAVRRRTGTLEQVYTALPDPYLRDRADDVRGLRRLLLRALLGLDDETPAEPSVLVVPELDAATAARLDASTLAVVTTHGGGTGHGVIVAASRGLPVLTGRREAAAVTDGTLLGVDGATGRLWVAPSPAEVTAIRALAADRAAEAAAAAAAAHAEARTTGGRRVPVEANVGSLADAAAARAAGADGVGLVRTELLFGDRTDAPTAEEQARVLVEVARAVGGPVTVRTWDPGGDKPLLFLPQPREQNPMLGERGIRAMRAHEGLLRAQLRGVALAAADADVRVMVPMVTEPDEVRWARRLLDDEVAATGGRSVPFGIMVEVPAAALRAADFAGLVDFVSIGTNDLVQYLTAADRGNGAVSHLARPDAAALDDLVATVTRALPGTPVAVCGDLASDPAATARLLGLGVTGLSVRPPLVGLVKQAVRRA